MSSNEPSTSKSVLPLADLCTVCGAPANGKRYGALSCLGCIVFFRRTVLKNMKYRCQKQGACEVTVETRCVCRSCRMQKCLEVGMSPEAIQIRDVIGPRRPKHTTTSPQTSCLPSPSTPSNSRPPSILAPTDEPEAFNLETFIQLQRTQREHHKNYSQDEEKFTEGCVFMKSNYHRRANSSDINLALKLAIENSNQWALQFVNLDENQRNSVLSEFSIGFMLIDQSIKTIEEADEGFWLLQNGSFLGLHPDFRFGDVEDEEKEKSHFDFVTQLLNTIGKPFQNLKIDEFESAILKILLLLTPSFPDSVPLQNLNTCREKCMKLLIDHSMVKPGGPERVGEIILLISSIRCAVKAFYNITKVSDLFDVNNFDILVRNVLVE